MENISNRIIVKDIIESLCNTISKRTSQRFGFALVEAISKSLEKKYNFLNYIKFNFRTNPENPIDVSFELDSINPSLIGRSMEAIIQVICLDLKDKASSSFIDEFSENMDSDLINRIRDFEIDLDLLRLQQKYIYHQHKRKKHITDHQKVKNSIHKENTLSYSWENVDDLKYDDNSKTISIIGKDGNILDNINLDKLVIDYLVNLTSEETSQHQDEKIKKENTLKLK
jgi:hypothetical protein